MMNRSMVVLSLFCAVSFFVGRAAADGVPTASPLFYAGTIEQNGVLATGTVPIGIKLFNADTGGDEVCDVNSVDREVIDGRFRIDMGSCRDAVAANADVFVEVSVNGAPLPRQKLGAVPYAIEANRAQQAVVASSVVGGAIDSSAIADRGILGGDIAQNSIGSDILQANSVGSAQIADGAVTSAKAPTLAAGFFNSGGLFTEGVKVFGGSVVQNTPGGVASFTFEGLFPLGVSFTEPPFCTVSGGSAGLLGNTVFGIQDVTTTLLTINATKTDAGLFQNQLFRANFICVGI